MTIVIIYIGRLDILKDKGILKYELGPGINLHVIPDVKFKTVFISYCFRKDLNDDYTYNALLPTVLKRGCEGFENIRKIETHLEEQYGAIFDVSVQKKGESQILSFFMDLVNEAYLSENGVLAQAFYFMNRVITKPVIENSLFKQEYVDQEAENLKNRIASLINDKMSYSIERCIQEMCKGEKYSRYVFGSIKDLEELDPERLFKVYEDTINYSPLDIFVTGNVDPEKIYTLVSNSLDIERTSIKTIPETAIKKVGVKEKEVIEEMDVSQAKLNMGFRTNTHFTEREYYPLLVYSSILGGGPHSKLFINVREKASLAYYAFSRLEKHKGLMIIGSGIEKEKYNLAKDIILQQLSDMRKGKISKEELIASKKSIITSLRGAKDQQSQLVDYYLSNAVGNSNVTLDELIEEVNNVTMEQVVDISERIKLDTIYLLSPKEGRLSHGKNN